MKRTRKNSACGVQLIWPAALVTLAGCAGLPESPEEVSPLLTLPDFAQKAVTNPPPVNRAAYQASPEPAKPSGGQDSISSVLKVTLKGPESVAEGAPANYEIAIHNIGTQAVNR